MGKIKAILKRSINNGGDPEYQLLDFETKQPITKRQPISYETESDIKRETIFNPSEEIEKILLDDWKKMNPDKEIEVIEKFIDQN